MDKTICGHERRVLAWALTDAKRRSAGSVATLKGLRLKNNYQQAIVDVNDPAKLAEMLAARGREIGLAFWHGPNEPREPSPTDYVLYVIDGVIRLYSPLSPKTWQRHYTITQARAILLQWLRLPDGAHGEASRALRGEP